MTESTGPRSPLEVVKDPMTERHATTLELFLDLVFVFAVTQVAEVLGSGERPADFGRGVLLAWLVWWLWSQFTWLGTAIDLATQSVAQFLVLLAVPLTLVVAVAIPGAFEDSARWFAAAYLATNTWALAIQGRGLWGNAANRRSWLQYAPVATVAPVLLVAGSFLSREPRTIVWIGVALLQATSAVLASRQKSTVATEWTIDPQHFAERHSLFVIISLGEVLVAVGVAATKASISVETVVGIVAAVAVAGVLWWSYFAYVPSVIEARLRSAAGHQRGAVARNLFTFGHFPIILGVLLYSLVAKHMVSDPFDHLRAFDLVCLALGIAGFVGGILGLQWMNVRQLAVERVVTIAVVAGWCAFLGRSAPGATTVGAVAAALAVMQVIRLRRFSSR